jgi:hypothetical protein
MLTTLKVLNMRVCKKINDLSELIHLKQMIIEGKFKFTANSAPVISQLAVVEIYHNDLAINGTVNPDAITSLSWLENVRGFCLYYNSIVMGLPMLSKLRSLTICFCENFNSLPLLPTLEYLDISYCEKLQSLHLVGGSELPNPLYKVKIDFCPNLKSVTFHRKVFHCTVTSCKALHTLEILCQMDLLQIAYSYSVQRIINKALIVCLDFTARTRHYCTYVVDDIDFGAKIVAETELQSEHFCILL